MLTEAGRRVLALYRDVERAAAQASAERLDAIQSMLRDMSDGK